ncbi:MAG TPA: SpoIIE family protein phosphatase [Methanoregulaceae archaeon]|nr:SpoIIE family protein phosphatase [Methanoregulaceae archaeon]
MPPEAPSKIHLGVTTKIFIVFLTLSMVSLILVSFIAFTTLNNVGNYAAERSLSLGDQAVQDSGTALETSGKERLLSLAKDQADISNVIFENVEGEMAIMASYAGSQMESPVSDISNPGYSQAERPPSIYNASVYLFAPGIVENTSSPEFRALHGMDTIFIPVLASDPHLASVYAGSESGITRLYPWASGIAPSFDARNRGWYTAAMSAGSTTWSAPYVDVTGRGLMVTCSRPVRNDENGWTWVIGADVTIETINQQIINTQIGRSGYAMLIDEKGNIIARPGATAGSRQWDEIFEMENLSDSENPGLREAAAEMITGGSGVKEVQFGEGDKFVAFAPINSTNWSVVVVMPVDEITAPARDTGAKIKIATGDAELHIQEQVDRMKQAFLVLFILLFALIAGLTIVFARVITDPLRRLSKGSEEIGHGNLDYKVEVRTGDEFEDLAQSFNTMGSDLKNYIGELKRTTAEKERIARELQIARDIQQSFLPDSVPEMQGFELAAFSLPALEVGGDFYDFIPLSNGCWGLVIADVSGKGVPAALFMALSRTLVRASTSKNPSPSAAIMEANHLIVQDTRITSMFVTLFYAIIDPALRTLTYVNAGHNPPMLFQTGTADVTLLRADGIALGVVDDIVLSSVKIGLKSGDIAVLYTDGLTEAINEKEEEFGTERLNETIRASQHLPVQEMVRFIVDAIMSFAGEQPQADDITIIVLKAG